MQWPQAYAKALTIVVKQAISGQLSHDRKKTITSAAGLKRLSSCATPAENYVHMQHLLAEMEMLRPYPKRKAVPRVYRFKTWQEANEFKLRRAAERI